MRWAPVGSRYFAPRRLPRLDDDGRRALLGGRRLDDDHLREAGDLVGLLADVLALDDVLELDLAADLGEDGGGERIPVDERAARLRRRWPSCTCSVRAVDERVALLLAAVGRAGLLRFGRMSSMISSLPLRLMTTRSPFLFVTVVTLRNCTVPGFLASCFDCSETRDAVPPTWKVRMVSCVPGSPIDCAAMTPTASPISTMLAAGEVAAVAAAADAAARLAGEHRTDLHLLDARFLDRVAPAPR